MRFHRYRKECILEMCTRDYENFEQRLDRYTNESKKLHKCLRCIYGIIDDRFLICTKLEPHWGINLDLLNITTVVCPNE